MAIQCGRLSIHPGTGSAAVEPGAQTGAQSYRGAQASRAPALPASHASAPRVWTLAQTKIWGLGPPEASCTHDPNASSTAQHGTAGAGVHNTPIVSQLRGSV